MSLMMISSVNNKQTNSFNFTWRFFPRTASQDNTPDFLGRKIKLGARTRWLSRQMGDFRARSESEVGRKDGGWRGLRTCHRLRLGENLPQKFLLTDEDDCIYGQLVEDVGVMDAVAGPFVPVIFLALQPTLRQTSGCCYCGLW